MLGLFLLLFFGSEAFHEFADGVGIVVATSEGFLAQDVEVEGYGGLDPFNVEFF